MRHFAAAEADGNLDLVTGTEKFLCLISLCLEIVCIDTETQTDFLYLDNLLIFLSFLFPFRLLETILSVVHYFTDRRSGVGRDVNEIKISCIGCLKRLCNWKYTKLRTVRINNTDLFEIDILVYG